MLKSKKQKALAGVLAIGLVGASTVSAQGAGFNLNDLLGISGGLKDNQIVKDVMSFYTKIGDTFSTEIQNYTNITQQAIDQIRGVQGQFTPIEAKKEIDQKVDPNNPLSVNTNIGKAALGTNENAGNQVLSKQGQEAIKATNKKMEKMEQLTTELSDDVFFAGVDAQGSSSSQEVLKTMSLQLSGQADIAAAQVRMSVVQNTSMMDLKMNTAALNVAAASELEREMGKNQADKIDRMNSSASHLSSVQRNLLD
jgi:hypothetical protein